jgi:short-subunit dehydrogenase
MMAINVKPLVHTAQAVVPHWKTRGHGHLIYVSSGLARMPFASIRSAYSASKAAATALVSALRIELRATHPNILASTVFPGIVATGFGANALHGGPDSRALPGAQPVDEVAEVIAELIASRRAEVYTRPQMAELAGRYYSAPDVAVIESQPPFTMQPR